MKAKLIRTNDNNNMDNRMHRCIIQCFQFKFNFHAEFLLSQLVEITTLCNCIKIMFLFNLILRHDVIVNKRGYCDKRIYAIKFEINLVVFIFNRQKQLTPLTSMYNEYHYQINDFIAALRRAHGARSTATSSELSLEIYLLDVKSLRSLLFVTLLISATCQCCFPFWRGGVYVRCKSYNKVFPKLTCSCYVTRDIRIFNNSIITFRINFTLYNEWSTG